MSDEDPEVRADIELRARTMRDSSRGRGVGAWIAPVFVTSWLCRVCKAECPVTGEAVEQWKLFNRMLARRNEAAIKTSEIMFCDRCRAEYVRTAPERRRGQVDRMQPVIAKLKRSKNPEQEREAIKQLEAFRHPDIIGLVAAIRARIESKGTRTGKGEL